MLSESRPCQVCSSAQGELIFSSCPVASQHELDAPAKAVLPDAGSVVVGLGAVDIEVCVDVAADVAAAVAAMVEITAQQTSALQKVTALRGEKREVAGAMWRSEYLYSRAATIYTGNAACPTRAPS